MAPLLGSLVFGAAALTTSVSAKHWPLPEGYHRFAPRAEGFQWGKCYPDKASRECSRFEVPLDWADHAAGKASLFVARYKATKEPKLGTIFMNPGGPGGSGVDIILGGLAIDISEASGGQYDIVSWDPRGVGKTVPRAECFTTWTEENSFWEGTIPRAGLEARGNFTNQDDIDAFYKQVPEVDRLLEELGKRCIEYSKDTFQYIGTAAVVRDMIAMHDILEGSDKPIHYWGFSYGTVIGSYFINMFPERVGRVVLDGVVDPELWANKPSYQKWAIEPESTDQAFNGFLQECAAAGSSRCAIASSDSNPETIRKYVFDLIDSAYYYKLKVGPTARYRSADIRSMIYHGMYTPSSWSKLARDLAKAHEFLERATGRQTARSLPASLVDTLPLQSAANNISTNDYPAPDYAFQGVTCADATDPGSTSTKDVFDFLVHVTRTVSPMFGPSWGDGGFYCHHWPVRAVERYTGPWNKQLANPILVIGNKADPVTPFVSAKKVADALGDSAALIQQDEYGHTSLAMHSNCTIAALKNYFVHNKLPTHELHCGTDQPLFPEPILTKGTLDELNAVSNSTSTSETESNSFQGVFNKARQNHNLLIVTIALAAATGLVLLVSLLSHISGRYKLKSAYRTYNPRIVSEKASEAQGHVYDGPYALGAETKSGGYSHAEA
ncbi:unnamed protein product [Rhizoctonia solani]|uniref:Hydrolase, putative n=1 Tax=Rhizoctonia solani AG-3 Rhs1AP TaxID=1086054 RepID=X8IZK8_9AGAM|nr:hydrolase, putative [Rhizoctonia solani AG-3 Rhs1AP]CAE6371345.1 unnamed protein product [Rhizoctonia solani]